jgi:hypothetical protein
MSQRRLKALIILLVGACVLAGVLTDTFFVGLCGGLFAGWFAVVATWHTAPPKAVSRAVVTPGVLDTLLKLGLYSTSAGATGKPDAIPTQLGWDVLRGHHAAEDLRVLCEVSGWGIADWVQRVHWLMKETVHMSSHPLSRIHGVSVVVHATGGVDMTWQQDSVAHTSSRSLHISVAPGVEATAKTVVVSKDASTTIDHKLGAYSQRDYMNLLGWVSRGEED